MIHPPFSSLEAMLSIETMSALEGRAVTRVEVRNGRQKGREPHPVRVLESAQLWVKRESVPTSSSAPHIRLTW